MGKTSFKQFLAKDFLILIPIAVVLIVQIPNLSLPYFWDEGWSYMNAILKMAAVGPTLLPGSISIDYCKGHPQLFYFLAAIWLKIKPESILFMRLLPLLLSIALLVVTYFKVKKLANRQAAFAATLLISVQSTFLAQSILVLPEVLFSLLLVAALCSFIQRRYVAYSILGSLMVLTKETAIIYLFVAGVFYLSASIKDRHEEAFNLKNLLLIAAPGIVWGVFLLLHYASYGVFFYQDHLSYIDFSPAAFQKRLGGAVTTALVHSGRVLMLIGFLMSYFIQKFFFKQKLNNEKTFLLIWISMLCFLIFLSFNFYTPRYALNLIILLCIVFAIAFSQLTIPNAVKHAITVVFALICLFFSINTKRNIDIDLGYVEVIKVNQQMVDYLEKSDLYNQPISASFNLYHAITNSGMGYLENQRTFTNLKQLDDYRHAKYFAFETTAGKHPAIEYVKANFKLVKEFSDKHAWGFIYENPSPELPDSR